VLNDEAPEVRVYFAAMWNEEERVLRYMLTCLGIEIEEAQP
jgi:hypothetical protein